MLNETDLKISDWKDLNEDPDEAEIDLKINQVYLKSDFYTINDSSIIPMQQRLVVNCSICYQNVLASNFNKHLSLHSSSLTSAVGTEESEIVVAAKEQEAKGKMSPIDESKLSPVIRSVISIIRNPPPVPEDPPIKTTIDGLPELPNLNLAAMKPYKHDLMKNFRSEANIAADSLLADSVFESNQASNDMVEINEFIDSFFTEVSKKTSPTQIATPEHRPEKPQSPSNVKEPIISGPTKVLVKEPKVPSPDVTSNGSRQFNKQVKSEPAYSVGKNVPAQKSTRIDESRTNAKFQKSEFDLLLPEPLVTSLSPATGNYTTANSNIYESMKNNSCNSQQSQNPFKPQNSQNIMPNSNGVKNGMVVQSVSLPRTNSLPNNIRSQNPYLHQQQLVKNDSPLVQPQQVINNLVALNPVNNVGINNQNVPSNVTFAANGQRVSQVAIDQNTMQLQNQIDNRLHLPNQHQSQMANQVRSPLQLPSNQDCVIQNYPNNMVTNNVINDALIQQRNYLSSQHQNMQYQAFQQNQQAYTNQQLMQQQAMFRQQNYQRQAAVYNQVILQQQEQQPQQQIYINPNLIQANPNYIFLQNPGLNQLNQNYVVQNNMINQGQLIAGNVNGMALNPQLIHPNNVQNYMKISLPNQFINQSTMNQQQYSLSPLELQQLQGNPNLVRYPSSDMSRMPPR